MLKIDIALYFYKMTCYQGTYLVFNAKFNQIDNLLYFFAFRA